MPSLLAVVQPSVDLGYLVDETGPEGMLQIEDVVHPPVQVVGDVRDLLVESVGRVRQDRPSTSPATSTTKSCSHCGQVTAAWV